MATDRKPSNAAPEAVDVPDTILADLRTICLGLAGAYEEAAWVGTRWCVAKHTFAHVLVIDFGWPPAYARAAGTDGPQCVLTFRSAGPELEALTAIGHPFFRPVWGTKWKHHVIGMMLDADADWEEVSELLTESYRLLAPQ